MADITVEQEVPYDININTTVNGGSSGAWILGSSSITHNNNRGSYAKKYITELTIGNIYRISYTISSYTNCNVRLYLGDTAGTVRTSSGTFTEILTLTGVEKKISFYSSGTATISHYKIEELESTIHDVLIDPTEMQNKSWTLSYNPILNQWVSFHSYLPNNYIQHPTKLLAKRNNSQLQLVNSGIYGKYFDEDIKPFIVETIINEYGLETKVFDSITVNLDSTNNTGVNTNKFFDNGILYTEYQCSGTITFNTSNLTKKERNWNFNKFLDITNNLSEKVFVEDWASTKLVYPIDKVINVNKIDNTKAWYKRGRFRDKYLSVRFIENNLENQKFICKFVSCIYRKSER